MEPSELCPTKEQWRVKVSEKSTNMNIMDAMTELETGRAITCSASSEQKIATIARDGEISIRFVMKRKITCVRLRQHAKPEKGMSLVVATDDGSIWRLLNRWRDEEKHRATEPVEVDATRRVGRHPGASRLSFVDDDRVAITSRLRPTAILNMKTSACRPVMCLERVLATVVRCVRVASIETALAKRMFGTGVDAESDVLIQGDRDGSISWYDVGHRCGGVLDVSLCEPIRSVIFFRSRRNGAAGVADSFMVIGRYGTAKVLGRRRRDGPVTWSECHLSRSETKEDRKRRRRCDEVVVDAFSIDRSARLAVVWGTRDDAVATHELCVGDVRATNDGGLHEPHLRVVSRCALVDVDVATACRSGGKTALLCVLTSDGTLCGVRVVRDDNDDDNVAPLRRSSSKRKRATSEGHEMNTIGDDVEAALRSISTLSETQQRVESDIAIQKTWLRELKFATNTMLDLRRHVSGETPDDAFVRRAKILGMRITASVRGKRRFVSVEMNEPPRPSGQFCKWQFGMSLRPDTFRDRTTTMTSPILGSRGDASSRDHATLPWNWSVEVDRTCQHESTIVARVWIILTMTETLANERTPTPTYDVPLVVDLGEFTLDMMHFATCVSTHEDRSRRVTASVVVADQLCDTPMTTYGAHVTTTTTTTKRAVSSATLTTSVNNATPVSMLTSTMHLHARCAFEDTGDAMRWILQTRRGVRSEGLDASRVLRNATTSHNCAVCRTYDDHGHGHAFVVSVLDISNTSTKGSTNMESSLRVQISVSNAEMLPLLRDALLRRCVVDSGSCVARHRTIWVTQARQLRESGWETMLALEKSATRLRALRDTYSRDQSVPRREITSQANKIRGDARRIYNAIRMGI